jgi:uncharacterized membrane protein YkvI
MSTNTNNLSTFKVAAVYIGTVVGAGFASGQEVLQFFGFFGAYGIPAIMLVTLLFGFFGLIILRLGNSLQAQSYREVINHAGGRWLGSVIDAVITFFLFGALTAMAAGAGAIFTEQFGLSHLFGSLIITGITIFTVLLGVHGVINSISYIVPVLLVSVLGISIISLVNTPLDFGAVRQWAQPSRAPVPFWPLSAVNYVSYNMVLSVAILAPLGRLAQNPQTLNKGAFYGGIGLGVSALAIQLALLTNIPAISGYEVPMIYIASQISPVFQFGYSIVLLLEVYTTAVGSLYGFIIRFTQQESARFKWLVIGTGVVAFAASQLGFSNLVRILYPAVGYAGLLMLGGLLYGFLKEPPVMQPAFKRIKLKGKKKH